MILKLRTVTMELKIVRLLNKRKKLTSKEKQHFISLQKGYEGEVLFDTYISQLKCDCFVLNDLLLEINNTTFQIDSLLITPQRIYLFEVKNYQGNYVYESDKLFKRPHLEVVNPLHQLSRSESLLRQLLLKLGTNPQIDASVVFINPAFTLYQAPLDKPIIFQTQIYHYMEKINQGDSKLSAKHRKLADQLVSLDQKEYKQTQIEPYDYTQLQKGITCLSCFSFSVIVEKGKCICKKCGFQETVSRAVLRSVEEFHTLFPSEKLTTNVIHDWCQIVQLKQRIRRILASNYKIIGVNQWTYYT
ncbi:nuclease-related domain-containing protein [Oceanobacillus manasiensis]|uniref:nuclease-related domain-containing protein n=1 Tax=Oceanobacillus manasiensis TaxID=586413 RepID=UPI0005A9069C|nr:nuclease-related domain-containing protein [Oceanobacillus manasiensis]